MNEIFKGLSLGTLLRNFFAGFIFIAACWLQFNGTNTQIWNSLPPLIPLLTLASLTMGAILYALHRATLNTVIEIIRYLSFSSGESDFCDFLFPQKAREAMINRWNMAAEGELLPYLKNIDNSVNNNLTDQLRTSARKKIYHSAMKEWADYIHLLYTSALALSIGTCIGHLSPFASSEAFFSDIFLYAAAGLILIVGVFADIRRHIFELHIDRELLDAPDQSVCPCCTRFFVALIFFLAFIILIISICKS